MRSKSRVYLVTFTGFCLGRIQMRGYRHHHHTRFGCFMKRYLSIVLCMLTPAVAMADLETDVPEAARDGYQLMYRWTIPTSANLGNLNVNYDIDNTDVWDGSFDRIAYYLKLKKPNEAPQFIFISGRAWEDDTKRISIPRQNWRYPLEFAEMTVVSNVDGIVTGDGLTGWLEIWNSDYGRSNALGVPGASNNTYDFGDEPVGDGGGYGSFQIHNPAAQQTLLAVNRFNGGPMDVGIGNHDGQHPDWTFSENAGQYEIRHFEVLVRPGDTPDIELPVTIEITSPTYCHIHQRWPAESARIRITGRARNGVDTVEVRFIDLATDETTNWTVLDAEIADGGFDGETSLSSGWYRLEARGLEDGVAVERGVVSGIGVGEVFMIAGQSNSANSGEPQLVPTDPRVCSGALGSGWQFGADPQPGASGNGGSPWPAFADLIAQKYDVPIGLVSVGVGGTQVQQWQPGHSRNLFQNLLNGAEFIGSNGARMLLWHQGESDSVANTSSEVYARRLADVITSMRHRIGWSIPWAIAQAAYTTNLADCRRDAPMCENVDGVLQCIEGTLRCPASDAVLEGQRQVASTVEDTVLGPTTEDLTGDEWRYDGVHFNEAGLREHGARWAAKIKLPQCRNLNGVQDEWYCQNGEPLIGCPPTGPVAEVCNTIDDDCDGQIDEGLAAESGCGVGACSAVGETRCENGVLIDTCIVGTPVMETCDGIDNDCDAATDEDVADEAMMCGVGAYETADLNAALPVVSSIYACQLTPHLNAATGPTMIVMGMDEALNMEIECGICRTTAPRPASMAPRPLVHPVTT